MRTLYPAIARVTRSGPLATYPCLYWPYAKLFKTGPHPDLIPWSLPTPETDLVIEEPGSSANHSLAAYFLKHNPNAKLATLTHCAAPVRYAAKRQIPCIVLVRDIIGYVESSTARFSHLYTRNGAVRCYTSFYKGVLPVLDRVVIGRFAEVTANPAKVIEEVNRKFGTDFHVGDGVLPRIRGTANKADDGYDTVS